MELSSEVKEKRVDRRQWLQLCGGVAVVGLAGCVGGDDNGDDNGNGTDNGHGASNGNETGNGNGADDQVTVGIDPDQYVSFNRERHPVTSPAILFPPDRVAFSIGGALTSGGEYLLSIGFPHDENGVVDVSDPYLGELSVFVEPESFESEIYRDRDESGQQLVDVSAWDLSVELGETDGSLRGTLFLAPFPGTPQETFPDGVDIELDITTQILR